MRPIATTRSAAGLQTGLLAVWWVLASEIVIFGGLLGSYIMYRLAHDAWSEQAAFTNVWIGAFNTFVLLTSSLKAVLAHQAAEQGDGKLAAKRLYYTCIGAATFIGVKAFEWATEISHGMTITSNTFVLLTSSLFAVLAHAAAERGDGKLAARRLWYTIGGGGMFLCIKAFEWNSGISNGMTISSSSFWVK